ncbi:MAG: glycosyltransferase family 2 protein [Bacteroidales bacterium]|jgi:GT2 family glycosyltransferase|nr:glycosyltransferase family 2 protein [Bacteroidales bacterium]
MDVSIIIINYNTISFLCDAIDSIIEKAQGISYEIIVVDNNSSDNSDCIISEKFADKVVYVKLPENIGFGRANNEGIKIAKGKNLFLLNPDTILRNNAVKILSNYMNEHQNVGVCCGNIFDADGSPAYSFMPVFQSIFYEIDLLLHNMLFRIIWGKKFWFNKTEKPKYVAHVTGADMMVRRCIALVTGGFDSDFFMYGEETEWIYRIKKLGYKVVSVPQAEIIHFAGKSFDVNTDRIKMILSGRNLFYHKTHGSIYCSIANLIYGLTALSRIVFFALAGNKIKTRKWSYILKNICS